MDLEKTNVLLAPVKNLLYKASVVILLTFVLVMVFGVIYNVFTKNSVQASLERPNFAKVYQELSEEKIALTETYELNLAILNAKIDANSTEKLLWDLENNSENF